MSHHWQPGDPSGQRLDGPAASVAPRLILASASPRRRELLSRLGIQFEVVPSRVSEDTDESAIMTCRDVQSPELIANSLAFQKAWDVAERTRGAEGPSALVLGADTVVAVGPQAEPVVLGKPAGPEDAREMLRMLSGATHSVHTGVTVVNVRGRGRPRWDSAVIETHVTFRDLTEADIEGYVATGEPFDKAGAYGIQGRAAAFVESVSGDYYNVVGLPLEQVWRMLRPHYPGVSPPDLSRR